MHGYLFIAPALAQEFRCLSSSVEGKKVQPVTDYMLLGAKITADGNCSQEIKRYLLLERSKLWRS